MTDNTFTWLLSDSWTLAKRNLEHVRRVPEKLLDVTLQPIMFTLLFAYVFGGVIHVSGGNYHEYLIGGIIVQTLGFGMMGPGVSIAQDIVEGVVDRFRSLPIRRSAYLIGHLIEEQLSIMLALAILMGTGLIVGWRIHSGLGHAVAGIALLIAFSNAMIWLGTLMGLSVRSADAVQGVAFTTIFPLTFVASTFVPLGGLPDGLRQFAEWNPFTALAGATRSLFGNPTAIPAHAPWPVEHAVLMSVLWCAALLAVLVPLALWRYAAKTRG